MKKIITLCITAFIYAFFASFGIQATNPYVMGQQEVKSQPRAVDLGLSVKWASCNLGANSPEEYGDYYAWGETETKPNYTWSTYKWCKGSYDTLTKYCSKSDYGAVDNKAVLAPGDDVARVKLGGKWRMPTDGEWIELGTECTWTWTTRNGINRMLVTGPNGNSIFLPAAGLRNDADLNNAGSNGNYWSSSLNTDNPNNAYNVNFNSDNVNRNNNNRYNGQSVRAVSAFTLEGLRSHL